MSDSSERSELLAVFLAESEENLATLEQLLVTIESSAQNEEAIHEIFRAAHTLKGNAACLGFDSVAAIAHGMEDLLDAMRTQELDPTPRIITLLLDGADAIKSTIPQALAGVTELPVQTQLLLEEMREIRTDDRAGNRSAGAIAPPPILESPLQLAAAKVAAVAAAGVPGPRPAAMKRLRVDLERLDRLLNLTGELGIALGRMLGAIESLQGETRDQFIESVEESDRLIESLQEEVTRIRMVPVGLTFQPHKRTVRDLSSATGKSVALVMEGAEVEIDAALVEQIKDPLTHMIRNAIDHGIEPPAAS